MSIRTNNVHPGIMKREKNSQQRQLFQECLQVSGVHDGTPSYRICRGLCPWPPYISRHLLHETVLHKIVLYRGSLMIAWRCPSPSEDVFALGYLQLLLSSTTLTQSHKETSSSLSEKQNKMLLNLKISKTSHRLYHSKLSFQVSTLLWSPNIRCT